MNVWASPFREEKTVMEQGHVRNGLKDNFFFLSPSSMFSLQTSTIPLVYGSHPSSPNHCSLQARWLQGKAFCLNILLKKTQTHKASDSGKCSSLSLRGWRWLWTSELTPVPWLPLALISNKGIILPVFYRWNLKLAFSLSMKRKKGYY